MSTRIKQKLSKISLEEAKALYDKPKKRLNKHVDISVGDETFCCTVSEYLFCLELADGRTSLKKAYMTIFGTVNPKYATNYGSKLLIDKPWLSSFVDQLREENFKALKFDKRELMGWLVGAITGEEKDRFGLDVSMQDRLQAAKQYGDIVGANAPVKQDIKQEVLNKGQVKIILPDDGTILKDEGGK